MSCRDSRAQAALERLFLGELKPSEHEWLREHARGCESCREQYERISRVSMVLEKPAAGIPSERLALLEATLLKRVQAKKPAAGRRWLSLAIPIMATAVLVVLLVPVVMRRSGGDEFQPRGGTHSAFGIRAFCVDPGPPPHVVAEARSGQALRCAAGSALQFTYTAPRAARLEIVGEPASDLQIYPREGEGRVSEGVDVPIQFSVPVRSDWLKGPTRLVARFREPSTGEVLGESVMTVTP